MKNKNKTAATEDSKPNPSRDGLRIGDVILRGEDEYVVWFVNDSRAAIAPLSSHIQFRIREDDGKLQFLAKKDSENISAHSDCKVIRSLGRKGLASLLEERKTSTNNDDDGEPEDTKKDKSMSKNKKTEKTETNGRPGKLGGYKGHSVTSVVRAMGKAGWTLDEARTFFEKKDIAVADTTIKIQLRAGVKGEGGDPAKFSKDELAAMKPKVKKAAAKEEPAPKSKKKSKVKPEPEEDETPEAEEDAEKEGEEVGAED